MTVAKSLEGANLVWQRVNELMFTNNSSPVSRAAFLRSLKSWLATQKGNPKLQYLSFSAVSAHDTKTTPELSTGGATLYALYAIVKKGGTDAISAFKWNDSASACGGANGANMIGGAKFANDKDEFSAIYQPGYPLATGLIVAAETTMAGGTDSSTTHGTYNGFAIVG